MRDSSIDGNASVNDHDTNADDAAAPSASTSILGGDDHHDHLPTPPPHANKIQLELWRRILSHRCQQMQTLSPDNFHLFVDVIALNLKSLRFHEEGAKGNKGCNLNIVFPPDGSTTATVSVTEVARHILTLFYQSVDERLSPSERVFGLDLVRKAFSSLDEALKDQRQSQQARENQENENTVVSQSQPRGVEQATAAPTHAAREGGEKESSSNKRARIEPELPSVHAHDVSGNQSRQNASSEATKKTARTEHVNARVPPTSHAPDVPGNQSDENAKKTSRTEHLIAPTAHAPGNEIQSQKNADNSRIEQQCNKNIIDIDIDSPGGKRAPVTKRTRIENTAAHLPSAGARNNQNQLTNSSREQQQAIEPPTIHEPNLAKKPRNSEPTLHPPGNQSQNNAGNSRVERRTSARNNQNQRSNRSQEQQIVEPPTVHEPNMATKPRDNQSANKSANADTRQKNKIIRSDPPPGKATTLPIILPPPIQYKFLHRIAFPPDNHAPALASGALHPRNEPCTLSYDAGFHPDGSGASMEDGAFASVRERLVTWDPYWKIVKELGSQDLPRANGGNGTMTKAWKRTASCTPEMNMMSLDSNKLENLPKSCSIVTVDLPKECRNDKQRLGVKWGEFQSGSYKTGDRRLLLRMLPLTLTEKDKKYRSDTHIWPIGTFVQLQRGMPMMEQVLLLAQRRQQNHDARLWKGACYPLDLTALLPDARCPFSIKICAKEKVAAPVYDLGTPVSKQFEDGNGKFRPFAGTIKSFDAQYSLYQIIYEDGDAEELTHEEVTGLLVKKSDGGEMSKRLLGSYGIHLAVCEYVEPDDLYDQLMSNHEIKKLSLESSQSLARRYLDNQTVQLESDTEEDVPGNSSGSSCSTLTFSLLCPMSRMPIGTPVRGERCKHMQCFDLKSFLHSNKHISSGRWRCSVCEDFLPVRDLVHCGLFEAMLSDHRNEVSGARDKVSVKSDGTWSLKEENKLRYGKKRGNGNNAGGAGVEKQAAMDTNDSTKKRSAPEPEVIDLL